MRTKNYKILCMFVIILCFLLGGYLECSRDDTSYSHAFNQKENSYLMASETTNVQTPFCTVEMLGNSGNTLEHQDECEMTHGFFYLHNFPQLASKNIVVSETILYSGQIQEELVTNYIHNSDGKK